MSPHGARRHWADDGDLADEIELYGELVVAASESPERLSMPEIDQVLGVSECPEAASCQTPCDAPERTVDVTDTTVDVTDRAGCESPGERPVSHA